MTLINNCEPVDHGKLYNDVISGNDQLMIMSITNCYNDFTNDNGKLKPQWCVIISNLCISG